MLQEAQVVLVHTINIDWIISKWQTTECLTHKADGIQ